MNHLPVGLKCYMIRPGYRVLDGITLQEGGLFNVEANEWTRSRENMSPQHLLHYYNRYVAKIQDVAIYNPLQFIFVSPPVGPLWACERLDLRTILDQGLTPEQLGKIGTTWLASIVATPMPASMPASMPAAASATASVTASAAASVTASATTPLNCLPVGLKCYMMRPGKGRLEGITLEKDGLFSVAATETMRARKNLHPRHLLHYYNVHLVGERDAAIYNPLDFIFVAEGGFCEGDSLRSILDYDWTPAQFAMVGRSVEAFPTTTASAATASFAPNPYSTIQPIKLDVAAVMARLDAAAAAAAAREQEEGELEELLPPPVSAATVAAETAAGEVFSTSEAGKKLLDSCGGFEALRPAVCAHLDPCCVQATVLDLEDEVHWIMLAGKGTAIWDELRAIQKHMAALRALL